MNVEISNESDIVLALIGLDLADTIQIPSLMC